MTRFRVYLTSVASTSVEVEADSGDEAVDEALGGKYSLPYASAFAGFELTDWSTNSELFPGFKAEDDYEEIAE